MRTMRHSGLLSIVLSIVALFSAPAFPVQVEAQGNLDIIEISVEDAAKFIRRDRGRVVLVLLYASWCPSCRNFFPDFLQLAGRYMDREVDVLAFSVDDTKKDAAEYLRGYDLTIVPMWLPPGPQGSLGNAMATVGITYGNYIPFVAVLDKKGRMVYQGKASVQALTRAIDASLKAM